MSTPYIGFSNDTLEKQLPVNAGDLIECPHCGNMHALEPSNPPLLLFYKCGEQSYLGGVNGRCTIGVKSDMSGEL